MKIARVSFRLLLIVLCLTAQSLPVRGQHLDVMTHQIEPRVAALRELAFQHDVEKFVQSPQDLQQVLQHELERMYPGDALHILERRLMKFGFIVSPIHIDQLLAQMLSQQIAGYYDPLEKHMVLIQGPVESGSQGMMALLNYLSEWLLEIRGLSLENVLLAHELTHVLQDQHFDLLSLPLEDLDQEDAATAALALVEGDAMLVMIDYMLHPQGLTALHVPDISDSLHFWTESPLLRGFGLFQTMPRYLLDNLL
ncbi:hypothetical protein GF339_08805, partial [candidate division KSB3 bacterium]|nr:hypothetical protein [candidate division KSB3 bacterium]MBD3324670.1 hypothetical protein [candidate division KSB3 bacterium]